MKSAYELAMERLAKSDPSAGPLTAGQKAQLAEIDRVYKGKWAEREIFLKITPSAKTWLPSGDNTGRVFLRSMLIFKS